MDRGHEVANPNRYNQTTCPDGTQREESALQHYYNFVADKGRDAAACELDNDPPEDTGATASGITPQMIQRQVSGSDRGIIPDGCTVLTHGIDVGKYRLHWAVRAWKPDATGYVIDYGTSDVTGAKYGTDVGLDRAIHDAVVRRMDEFGESLYMTADGERPAERLTLVDAGYRTTAVYSACMSIGADIYPVMGFGKSMGCVRMSFSPTQKRTRDVRPGDGWKMSRQGKIWLVEADTDRWKAWEHDRWMTATDQPGCLFMFGAASDDGSLTAEQMDHIAYARHICAEEEIEEVHNGALRRRWKPTSKENHWLDASYYANVAASMKGVRLAVAQAAKPTNVPVVQEEKKRISLRELKERKR
jgi:phage terminase large subunit GpA-like protein